MEPEAETTEAPQAEMADPPLEPLEPINPQLDKYNSDWKAVQDAPYDFNAWTTLITSAEKLVRACSLHCV